MASSADSNDKQSGKRSSNISTTNPGIFSRISRSITKAFSPRRRRSHQSSKSKTSDGRANSEALLDPPTSSSRHNSGDNRLSSNQRPDRCVSEGDLLSADLFSRSHDSGDSSGGHGIGSMDALSVNSGAHLSPAKVAFQSELASRLKARNPGVATSLSVHTAPSETRSLSSLSSPPLSPSDAATATPSGESGPIDMFAPLVISPPTLDSSAARTKLAATKGRNRRTPTLPAVQQGPGGGKLDGIREEDNDSSSNKPVNRQPSASRPLFTQLKSALSPQKTVTPKETVSDVKPQTTQIPPIAAKPMTKPRPLKPVTISSNTPDSNKKSPTAESLKSTDIVLAVNKRQSDFNGALLSKTSIEPETKSSTYLKPSKSLLITKKETDASTAIAPPVSPKPKRASVAIERHPSTPTGDEGKSKLLFTSQSNSLKREGSHEKVILRDKEKASTTSSESEPTQRKSVTDIIGSLNKDKQSISPGVSGDFPASKSTTLPTSKSSPDNLKVEEVASSADSISGKPTTRLFVSSRQPPSRNAPTSISVKTERPTSLHESALPSTLWSRRSTLPPPSTEKFVTPTASDLSSARKSMVFLSTGGEKSRPVDLKPLNTTTSAAPSSGVQMRKGVTPDALPPKSSSVLFSSSIKNEEVYSVIPKSSTLPARNTTIDPRHSSLKKTLPTEQISLTVGGEHEVDKRSSRVLDLIKNFQSPQEAH